MLVAETTLLAIVTPLLPHFADEFGLSRVAAGVLVAANPAGSIVGSLPAGLLVARLGARRTVVVALVLAGVASAGLGFSGSVAVIVAARFVQGVGGACSWAGAFAWLVEIAPRERRTETIGLGLSSVATGSIVGPAAGAIGALTSLELLFSLVTAVLAGLAVAVLAQREPPRAEVQPLRVLLAALRRPGLALPGWIIAVAGLGFGVIGVLAPLRLDHLGAATGLVGGVFFCAALAEAVTGRVAGGLATRHGSVRPAVLGLGVSAGLFWLLAVPQVPLVLGALVIALLTAITLFLVPGLGRLSAVADRVGLEQGLAFGLTNIAWGTGYLLGALGGGVLAGVGETLPGALVTVLSGLLLIVVWRTRFGAESPSGHGEIAAVAVGCVPSGGTCGAELPVDKWGTR